LYIVVVQRPCRAAAQKQEHFLVPYRGSAVKEAIELCLEVEGDTGSGLDFVGVQRIRLAS
jgi:hypothetical protein